MAGRHVMPYLLVTSTPVNNQNLAVLLTKKGNVYTNKNMGRAVLKV